MNKIASFSTNKMASILDKELAELSGDAFGHNHFAEVLKNLVEGEHAPPFSIGLLGSWGTGKSTIKELYLRSLRDDKTGSRGERRSDKVRAITFNAWRYGGEQDLKRALLRHAFAELGGDDEALRRELYNQVSAVSQVKRGLWEWSKEALFQVGASLFLFVSLLVVCVAILTIAALYLGGTGAITASAVVAVAAGVAAILGKYVVDLRLRSPALFNPQTTIKFPTTSAEEYERLLVSQIAEFRKKNKKCERLVVFVDDLDRLSATEMVSGLDAIRTFLELSSKADTDEFGVIFVISCDEDRVADALSKNRGRLAELPGSVFTRADARRYLDRLFQFRLEIPPFPKLDMRQFATDKLASAGSIAKEVEVASGASLQDIMERLIHVGVQSPRNAIQLINAFTQTWWLAMRREREGDSSKLPGGLYAGAVTKHPIALAALCVLRVDFPDFYNALQKRPELIQEFNRVVLRGEAGTGLAPAAEFALKEFLVVKDERVQSEVRPEHRQLRQYLASLSGVRWPKSLQPLLLLAEDSTSRKFGDGASALNDAFVSGDVTGVLEVFGHHLDNRPLDRDDVLLLRDLTEDLADETETRRVNGARVLAAIASRIPAELRNGIMVPLARSLIQLPQVRLIVGAKQARTVIETVGSEDRRDVAGRFITDLLTPQQGEWTLPNGETPNLGELAAAVEDAVALALDVRERDGLHPAADKALREWLLVRGVTAKEGATTLPFRNLESWVEEQAKGLIPFLGADYVDLFIAELKVPKPQVSDVSRALATVRDIQQKQEREGQESREIVWRQLTSMIALRHRKAVAASWETAAKYATDASSAQANDYLIAFADRLVKELNDEKAWALDREAGSTHFLDLFAGWASAVDSTSTQGLLPLLLSWAEYRGLSSAFQRGAEIMRASRVETWQSLMTQLVALPINGLSDGASQYIAQSLPELSDDQKTAWVAQLNVILNRAPPDDTDADRYRMIVEASDLQMWGAPPLQAHAQALADRVINAAGQPKIVAAFFPAALRLLPALQKSSSGNTLYAMFEQAFGIPESYVTLHTEIRGEWPRPGTEVGTYDGDYLSARATQFIQNQPATDGVGHVFESLVEMVDKGIAPETSRPAIAALVPQIWSWAPDSVISSLGSIVGTIEPTHVASAFAGSKPEAQAVKQIAQVIASNANSDRRIAITTAILVSPPAAYEGEPDGSLWIWAEALGEGFAATFRDVLTNTGITDDQAQRLVAQVLARKQSLGVQFFVADLASLLVFAGRTKANSLAFSQIEEIAALARNQGQRSAMANAFVAVLPSCSVAQIKTVAPVLRDLGGTANLEKNASMLAELDDDQLAAIVEGFPDSKPLRKALEQRSNEGE
ncbi:P-loop NTPase fold protein [Rhizobium ruizarguesonis]